MSVDVGSRCVNISKYRVKVHYCQGSVNVSSGSISVNIVSLSVDVEVVIWCFCLNPQHLHSAGIIHRVS